MAMDREELNRRRAAREAQRKKRKRQFYFRLAAAVLILSACGVGIFLLIRNVEPAAPAQSVMATEPEFAEELPEGTMAATEERASWEKPPEVIHLVAAGDLNVTDKVIWSGQTSGDFDYTKAFMDVAPIFSEADLAVLNFEGNVSGAPYGTETVSAPQQMIEALKNAGVDLLQVANSCTISNGLIGLNSTLNSIRVAGIEPVGAFANSQEFRQSKGYTICNVGDVKIAVVAFTKGLGGRGLPAGGEECVNLLYEDYYTTYQKINTDGIKKVLRDAESERPDLTVAMLHWGSEFNEGISDSQERIASLMQSEGVDVIIGTHSHLVQKIEYDELTGSMVAYSLGDFFGDGERGGTNYSIMLDLEITKDYDAGVTRVTDYSVIPIYILAEDECDGDRRVVRINNAMSAYELNFVDKITASAYANMEFALERIGARIKPE